MANAPTTAYTEVQIDDDSISLTLISESQDGATIEDTERFTFEQLQDMTGEHLTLHLSHDSKEALSKIRQEAAVGNLFSRESAESGSQQSGQVANLPEVGDVVKDGNPPSWSEDARMEVVGISDKSASEYVINKNDGFVNEFTVAAENPNADPDETVIEAEYLSGGPNTYAFPVSRLEDI